jgi:elongator complex protein 1
VLLASVWRRADRTSEADSSRVHFQDLAQKPAARGETNKVNTVCDAVRAIVEERDLVKYVETILTTHVSKSPPDYESALRVMLQLQGMLERLMWRNELTMLSV